MKMGNFKQIKSELENLGLSESQALIYLLLVQHGELRIQEITTLTQVPRSSVYESLEILSELGLVEKIVEDKFIKLKPYPLGSIKHGLNEKLLRLQSQLARVDHLEESITFLPPSNPSGSTIVRYYKGTSGARQLLWNTLKSKSTVYVYSEWGRGRYVGINFYKSFVAESKLKGIKEKVLVNPHSRVLESIQKYAGSGTSRTSVEDIHAVSEEDIFIKGETFIYDNIYAVVYLQDDEINGFEIESKNFTQSQRSIFETLWALAKPISRFL